VQAACRAVHRAGSGAGSTTPTMQRIVARVGGKLVASGLMSNTLQERDQYM
jgi:hypothetical protein